MFGKFTYSRSLATDEYGVENFTAVECSSFDEAIKLVDKGIYDRKLQIANENKKANKESAENKL